MTWIVAQAAENVSAWKEYGLAGLVIMALFALVSFLLKIVLDLIKGFREDIKSISSEQTRANAESVDKFVALHQKVIESIQDRRI